MDVSVDREGRTTQRKEQHDSCCLWAYAVQVEKPSARFLHRHIAQKIKAELALGFRDGA